jgi:glycosyltransferase involved in cell wall biosynthesis
VALRRWKGKLVDPKDVAECAKTTVVLERGTLSLATAVARQVICAPKRFLTALRLAMRMMRPSERPLVWHLIYLAEACWIAPQLAKREIAHIHAHFGTNSAEVAMLVSALSGIEYSFTVHGAGEYDNAIFIHLEEKVRRAAFVATVCSYVRGQIFRIMQQTDWPKVRVVRCGIDAAFAGLNSVVPADSNRLACVGRLCGDKGQILLIKAVETLVKEGRKFELILVGDGEHRNAIEQMISSMSLAGHVTLTGWATEEEVRQEILKARALILPSFAEALPIVIIEAMMLGRPVLSTYVAGIPELVINGETGWLFPAGSEEDMLAAVRACLDAPVDRLRAMGIAGRQRALRYHRADDQAQALSTLFETVIGRESKPCSLS